MATTNLTPNSQNVKMTKQQIMTYIHDNYQGWELSGWVIWKLAAECGWVARSTIYRAIKTLKDMGAMEGKTYIGRTWLSTDELLTVFAADDIPVWMSDKRYDELCRRFCCNRNAIDKALEWATLGGQIDWVNGGAYGRMFRVLRNEGAK